MNDPNNNHDLLDRAVAELMEAPVEEGPSAMAVARTMNALKSRLKPAPQGVLKISRASWMYRIAAVILIGACGVAGVLVFNHVGGGGSVAASEVARRLREARTLSCNWSMELPTGKTVTMKMIFKDPGKLRVEVPGAALTILDTSKGKLLVLNPMIKTAFALDVGEAKAGPENQATEMFDWIEKVKNTTGQQAQQVGGREINGVEAKGFLLNEQGMAYTVWADAKTGMPLRIEIPLDLGTFKTTVVMSDLVFDEKFDESMFDLQPPDGYLLMNFDVPMFHKPPGEEDIVALLRWYAAKSEGRFPKALDHWMDFAKLAKRSPSVGEEEVMEVMMRVGRTSVFLSAVGASNYAYLGTGGKIGDAQKVVFWYQVEGGTKYRAIYGDLHGADVSREQLPTSPQ